MSGDKSNSAGQVWSPKWPIWRHVTPVFPRCNASDVRFREQLRCLKNTLTGNVYVIYISVGYGRTAEGTISMNFGPLNREGGDRRLNVLITRARHRCEVFTNLTADDIDLRRTNARGVAVLQQYLQYAKAGDPNRAIERETEHVSPFSKAIEEELRRNGYRIRDRVGSAGFYIDLAVEDQDQRRRYVLGIECDGPTYYDTQSARDRDRLREEVLHNLGWRTHRIWSTAWFQNQRGELSRLIESVESARSQAEQASVSQATSPSEASGRIPRTIERMDNPKQHKTKVSAQPYRTARLEILPLHYELYQVPWNRMATWIQLVVQTESPVHQDEVARRIAEAAGVKRIGHRIRASFSSAVAYAVKAGMIARRGLFLWSLEEKKPTLRDRSNLPPSARKIEYVASEELVLAVERAVAASFGMHRGDIPIEAGRLLGFSRTTATMRQQLGNVVAEMIRDGQLVDQGDYIVVGSE